MALDPKARLPLLTGRIAGQSAGAAQSLGASARGRIAWALDLQRIIPAASKSLAPRTAVRGRRQFQGVDDPNHEAATTLLYASFFRRSICRSSQPKSVSVRRRIVQHPAAPRSLPRKLATDGAPWLTVGSPLALGGVMEAARRSRQTELLSIHHARRMPVHPRASRFQSRGQPYRPVALSSSGPMRSMAPISPLRSGSSAQSSGEQNSSPVVKDSYGREQDIYSMDHFEQMAPWSRSAVQQSSDPTSSNNLGVDNGNSAARVGRIHLDGAALGRWANEHLARALSGNPTGMTAIDPRVSAPRSTLSPF
jgi:hypothetical protein